MKKKRYKKKRGGRVSYEEMRRCRKLEEFKEGEAKDEEE